MSSAEQVNPASAPAAAGGLPRDAMIAVLESQPADSSYDDLLRELIAARAVQRGLADTDAGRVVPHEDAVARIRSWRE